jgi:hypothetical protein
VTKNESFFAGEVERSMKAILVGTEKARGAAGKDPLFSILKSGAMYIPRSLLIQKQKY